MKKMSLTTARFVLLLVSLLLARTMSAQDFTLSLEPGTATLIPNQNTSFVVSMAPLNGFTSQVTLAVGTLPAGVTAQFSPSTVTLPGTSLLQVTAATNATLGAFTLNIIATGGGITNTTSSSVTVNFGLLPLCTGAFEGRITDIQSGLPVPGALVQFNGSYYTSADTNGNYIITNVSLGSPDNTPIQYGLSATRTDYWQSAISYAYAVCDATNVVNFQVLKKEYGSVSGQVLALGGGPLTNVTLLFSGPEYTGVTSGTNGLFQLAGLQLNSDNAPATYNISANLSGYWQTYSNVLVQPNSNSVVVLVMQPVCTGTVQGRVIFADTGLPDSNSTVTVYGYNSSYVYTDTNGYYTATNVDLGFNNAPLNAVVTASYSGYYTGSASTNLASCGETVQMPTLALTPVPVLKNNYVDITGHAYDLQTGLPLTNAYIMEYPDYYGGYTDTNGMYYFTNVLVGTGTTTNSQAAIEASLQGYFSVSSNLQVYADEVVTQDVRMLKIGYGVIEGTVRDSVSTLPVTTADVQLAGAGYVNSNGFYSSSPIQLSVGNVPTLQYFEVTAPGYWPTSTNTTITDGVTNTVDVNLLKVCTGATIIGNVVDALTQKPITNATILATGSQYYYAYTDTNGSFIFTNITVGNDNSPLQNTLTASAPGYNPQSKSVTIFCNATIFTQFGQAETVFGNIDGFVTNVVTGLPLTNVFVGTGFGGSIYTDTNGYYSFTQVPLGVNGANASWTVTAAPAGFPPQTRSVTVSSNGISRLDFGFGQPPTALLVTAVGAPNPVDVGSNLLYLVTLTNTVADAQQVVLADALPPGVTYVGSALTNSPGTPFTAPVYSNNVVTVSAANFDSNSAVTVAIVVVPTVTGSLTNVATVTSTTTDLDPTGTNHTATVLTAVTNAVAPTADLALMLTENAEFVTLGSNVDYTLVVTNLGPNDAPDAVLNDTLPPGAVYVSATASQGSATPGSGAEHWDFGALSSHASATATLVVTPGAAGVITNFAAVTLVPGGSSVTDPNFFNNTSSIMATVTALVVTNPPPLTNVTIQALGPIAFNPQTGLYQQSVLFTNLSGSATVAIRIGVPGLPSFVTLYNATATTNGVPYVEYDQSVAAGAGAVFLLEYYDATRQPFVSTNFTVTALAAAAAPPTATGAVLQLDRIAFVSEGQLTIEFASLPGHTYVVQYSDTVNPSQWQTAWPPIVAVGTKTEWIDAGPPKTTSAPGIAGQRYYRVVQTN